MALNISSFDLTQLPSAEDDEFEFKSSITPTAKLKEKVACAVSGFGNSGGGVFVVGVDRNGNADGGLPEKVGNQDFRDWLDQVIHQVEPTPAYDIRVFTDANGRGIINQGAIVAAVAVQASLRGPHMAPDGRYYIRAGAHTVTARHFLVEAIWARRSLSAPRLVHIVNVDPFGTSSDTLILEVIALTETPALDARIDLSSDPTTMQFNQGLAVPMFASVIDRTHAFQVAFLIPKVPAYVSSLSVKFKDVAGNDYEYTGLVEAAKCLPPWNRTGLRQNEIANAIKELGRTLAQSGATFG